MELKNWKDYLLQVSLIIVSLFIAFGVERCNQRVKDNRKLSTYLDAIHEELTDELESSRMNLRDCENDIEDLYIGAATFSMSDEAKLPEGIGRTGQVFVRGVFRSFSPTSYELMADAGDALLIKELSLRQRLASIVAFRNDYIKNDLQKHDDLTLHTLEKVSTYIDINCVRNVEPIEYATCVTDRERLRQQGAADLSALLRHAELRAFHLELYIDQVQEVAALVDQAR